jgi:ubiquitin-conjugating enzyme E2 C
MSGDPGISAFPEGDDIFHWRGTINGSSGTVYAGMVYKLSLSFNIDYPFKPPKVKFENPCFHPNVDLHGNICLDILQVLLDCNIVNFYNSTFLTISLKDTVMSNTSK